MGDITDRIRKLLILSEGAGSPEEAATAAALAAKLMAKHGIDSVEKESPDTVNDNSDLNVELSKSRRAPSWKWALAWCVAEMGRCKPYKLHRFVEHDIVATLVAFIGRRSDAEICCDVFTYLMKELRRMRQDRLPRVGDRIQQYVPGRPPETVDRPYQRRWTRAFYDGAIPTIYLRMKSARDEAVDEARRTAQRSAAATVQVQRVETALVLLDKVEIEVERVAGDLGLRYQEAPERKILSQRGFAAGVAAGHEVDLDFVSDEDAEDAPAD